MSIAIERSSVEQLLGGPPRLLINGQWRKGHGDLVEVRDPGTGNVLTAFHGASAADIDAAVEAARSAFDSGPWRRLPAHERGEALWRLADLVESRIEDFAYLECVDQGAPLEQCRGWVRASSRTLRYYAGWADKIHGRTSDVTVSGQPVHAYTLREPVGVAALITPWNAPLLMAATKVAAALVVGCSAILKPAEETPLTATLLADLARQAGIPDGVLNLVPGVGAVAGAALAEHGDVDKVSFTGSTEVGRAIIRAAAGNIKKVTLELGGKSPTVLLPDADLSRAIPGVSLGIFTNSGQVCSAGSRLFVPSGLVDRVVSGVTEAGNQLRLGHGMEAASTLGPLISRKQLETVSDYVSGGVAAGAEVVTGGEALPGAGYFMPPTVVVGVNPGMRMVREEIFGPVVAVLAYDDVSDLEGIARMANDVDYGLNASVWTRDVSAAHQVARAFRAGRVGINMHSHGDLSMPTGGYKQSGWGRENGPDGVEPYLETKSVFAALDGWGSAGT